MKKCTKCDLEKELSEFSKDPKNKDGLRYACKPCRSREGIKYYQDNRTSVRRKSVEKYSTVVDYVRNVKAKSSCADCGSSYPTEPWLMEYDHVRGNKKGCVAALISTNNLAKVQEEIAKCDLVCVLCHRRRTAQRAGWVFSAPSP